MDYINRVWQQSGFSYSDSPNPILGPSPQVCGSTPHYGWSIVVTVNVWFLVIQQ